MLLRNHISNSKSVNGKKKRNSVLSGAKKMASFLGDSRSRLQEKNSAAGLYIHEFVGSGITSSMHDDDRLRGNIRSAQWWDPPQDSLPFEFCQDTSLHG